MFPDWLLLAFGVLLLAVKLTCVTVYLIDWRRGETIDEPDWR